MTAPILLGTFTRYYATEGHPLFDTPGAFLFQNERGEDLYDLRNAQEPGVLMAAVNDDNRMVSVGAHPLVPMPVEGGRVFVLPGKTLADLDAHLGKRLNPVTGAILVDPPRVPASVSKAQGKIALRNAGHLDQVKQIIAAAISAGDDEAEIWWNDATIWERGSKYVASIGVMLNLTKAQIDQLFIDAEAIKT